MISSNALCPCGSNKKYTDCCQLLIKGAATAVSAEALMRSRYCAFVIGESDYLLDSHHHSTRPVSLDTNDSPPWCKLAIIRSNKGRDSDTTGTVEFKATAIVGSRVITLHETSTFTKENGHWYYISGVQHPSQQEPKAGKIGRNSPCPCGSGKKYKKCCTRV